MPSLMQLFMVFRHGAKVPSPNFLQGDDKTIFKDHPGQLTNKGKMSLFHLGQSIRRRYGNFIGASFDAHKFFICSTDIDRTLMSAQCFCMGLFPPGVTQTWNPDNMWEPVPVHHLDFCSAGSLDNAQEDMLESIKLTSVNHDLLTENNKKTIAAFTNFASNGGIKPTSNVIDLLAIDDLTTMAWHHLTFPLQLFGMEDNLVDLKEVMLKAMANSNSKLGKSIIATLFKSFLERILDVESGRTACTTAIYSNHDLNVLAIVMALSDVDIKSPEFGANLIIEVHNSPDPKLEPEVHMWYARAAEAPSQRINFKTNNSDRIKLSDFKFILQNFLGRENE